MSSIAWEEMREKDAWHGWGASLHVKQAYQNNLFTEISTLEQRADGRYRLSVPLTFVGTTNGMGWVVGCIQTGTQASGETKEDTFERCIQRLLAILGRSQLSNPEHGFKNYFKRKDIEVKSAPSST